MEKSSNISVIIADDEVAIRNGLMKLVCIDPFDITIEGSADNGKSALELIVKHQPDIVIIDINMPKMDGLEVIRKCTDESPNTRFLVLSGYDDFTYAQTAICYGVKYYFLKPLNIAEFRKQFVKQCEEILTEREKHTGYDLVNLDVVLSSSKLLFLNELISGQLYHSDSMIHKMSELYVSLKNTSCCTIIIEFDTDLATVTENLQEVNALFVQPLFEGMTMESWPYDDHKITAIFNIDDDHNLIFRSRLNQCLKELSAILSIDVRIGIGSVVPSLDQCQLSFAKAQEALTYHIYMSETTLFDSSIINKQLPTFSKDHVDVVPLIDCIIQKNNDGIVDYCSLFFDALFFTQRPQPNFLFGMCIFLIMEVHKHLNTRYPELGLSMASAIEMINSFKSADSLRHWIQATLLSYPQVVEQSQKDSNKLIKKAKNYIAQNLQNNIKAKDVAAHVSLSTSYFTMYFKEVTGENFRDYILAQKMSTAIQLLSNKSISVGEIATMTGYQDYRSFSRAFKNAVGISPSEYTNNENG